MECAQVKGKLAERFCYVELASKRFSGNHEIQTPRRGSLQTALLCRRYIGAQLAAAGQIACVFATGWSCWRKRCLI